jgi:PAS domain S-box-containing protein
MSQGELEGLHRELERLRALVSKDRGLVDALLDASPHGILVADSSGKLILQNRAAERIWAGSATADTVAAWGQYRGFHPDGRPFLAEDWAMAQCLRERVAIEAREVHIQRFDDSFATLISSSAPIFTADGELEGAIAVFADITRLKQAEAAIVESEAVTAAMLAGALDCIVTIGEDGRVLEWNPAAERVFGYARAEAIGQELAELIVPVRHREAHRLGLGRALATGEGPMLDRRLELSAVRKDGSELPVELAITAARAGHRRFFTGYLRDISERRRTWETQRFLLEASKQLATSLEYEATLKRVARLAVPALADWCVIDIVEADGSLRRVEIAHADPERDVSPARDVAGAAEVIASGQALLVSALDPASAPPVLLGLEVRSYMIVPLHARGRILGAISLYAAESSLRFGDAELLVAEELARRAAIAVDNARLFREREQLIHSLERSNADLDAFAHVTSHDLKAPLRGIASLAEWLEEDLGPGMSDQAKHYLTLLRGRVERLAGLIEGVLAYSRADRTEGVREAVDVGDLLRETIALLAPPAHVTVQVAVPLPALQTTRVALQQVFLNLLGNAIKHGSRPGAPLLVRVEASAQGEFWEFAVADDGPGIAAAYHERVWQVFQTLAPRDRVESTGIGLSVVRKIVEHRGGRAWVESTPGQGATFRFTWPRIDRTPRQ